MRFNLPGSVRIAAALMLFSMALGQQASAGEYEVVGDHEFRSSGPNPTVFAIMGTADRGYLILGNRASREIRLLKVSEKGAQEWEQILAARPKARNYPAFAIESGDRGFWIVGRVSEFEFTPEVDVDEMFYKDHERYVRTPEVPFILKVDNVGKLQWRNPLRSLSAFRGARFICGVRTSDGFVLVGTRHHSHEGQLRAGGRAQGTHPWVVKLDSKGDLLWETVLPGGPEEIFNATFALTAADCGGPYLNADGSVVFGLGIFWYPTNHKDGVPIVAPSLTPENGAYSYLAVRVDAHGKPLNQLVLRSQSPGRLLRDQTGFLAVTNPTPARLSGVRRTWLRSDLSIQRAAETTPARYSVVLRGVSQARNGGLHIVGGATSHDQTEGGLVVVHLRPQGELTGMRILLASPGGWALEGYADNPALEEIAVALRFDSTVRVVRFKYKD